MVIRVSEIPDEGLEVRSPLQVGPVYPDPGWQLDRVDLRVERRDRDVDVTGTFAATARVACSRCLEPLAVEVAAEVEAHLVPAPTVRLGEVELSPDDLEVDFYTGDALDLAALLRSETDLALPMKPLCRHECRGLCPSCGANRNQTDCRCQTRGMDPRLAPLEALRRLT